MQRSKIINILSCLFGGVLVAMGAIMLVMASTAKISPESGRALDYAISSAYILAGAPFIVLTFSRSLAKRFAVVDLLLLSAALLWVPFSPLVRADHSKLFLIAAIAFDVLLISRIILSIRSKHRLPDS